MFNEKVSTIKRNGDTITTTELRFCGILFFVRTVTV